MIKGVLFLLAITAASFPNTTQACSVKVLGGCNSVEVLPQFPSTKTLLQERVFCTNWIQALPDDQFEKIITSKSCSDSDRSWLKTIRTKDIIARLFKEEGIEKKEGSWHQCDFLVLEFWTLDRASAEENAKFIWSRVGKHPLSTLLAAIETKLCKKYAGYALDKQSPRFMREFDLSKLEQVCYEECSLFDIKDMLIFKHLQAQADANFGLLENTLDLLMYYVCILRAGRN
jgi:hypothetical protein